MRVTGGAGVRVTVRGSVSVRGRVRKCKRKSKSKSKSNRKSNGSMHVAHGVCSINTLIILWTQMSRCVMLAIL